MYRVRIVIQTTNTINSYNGMKMIGHYCMSYYFNMGMMNLDFFKLVLKKGPNG